MQNLLFHGWLVVSKPKGPTSFDVIRHIRRALPKKIKCGHAGTLDPLASGILPIALGEATKVISWLMDLKKTYRFEVTWGEQRTTDDQEGDVMMTSSKRPTLEEIKNILPSFQGQILQIPPLYSALKIEGKRACDRMRNQEDVSLSPRPVMIHQLRMMHRVDENRACFEVVCGKGTYVRSLARDMAEMLGTKGFASAIHRVCVGPFKEDCAISMEKLAMEAQKGVLQEYIQPLDAVLDDILAARVDGNLALALRQGRSISLNQAEFFRGLPQETMPTLIYAEQQGLIALAKIQQGQIWPKRVFNI